MLKNLLKTDTSLLPLVLRITVGAVMFAHGAQKMTGIWGGHGISQTINDWNLWFGFPGYLTLAVIFGEFFGSIFLVAGFLTRFCAAAIAIIMLGAIYFVCNQHFFMNWYAQSRAEGFEMHLLVLGITLCLMYSGGGRASLDLLFYKLMGRRKKDEHTSFAPGS